jgi:hypothetical protein
VEEKNEQIAHRRIVAGREILRNHGRNNNSPATGYISRVETGRIETPPFEMIQKIGDALQVDVY